MFEMNPFAELSTTVSVDVMQGFVSVMIALVAGGTLFDIIHKGSAKYFFQRWGKEKGLKQRDPAFGETVAVIAKTTAHDVLTQGEFCSFKRRLAHLLSMWGFVAYATATSVMVYSYPTDALPRRPIGRNLVGWCRDGLRRRLLVLVLYPGRRCSRGQFTIQIC